MSSHPNGDPLLEELLKSIGHPLENVHRTLVLVCLRLTHAAMAPIDTFVQ